MKAAFERLLSSPKRALSNEESQSFLPNESDSDFGPEKSSSSPRELVRQNLFASSILHWILHLVLLAFLIYYVTDVTSKARIGSSQPWLRPEERIYSDIGTIIQSEYRTMEPHTGPEHEKDMSWIGRPNRRNWRLWHDLTSVGVLSISDSEQRTFGIMTSRANDTDEYFVVPQVFHDLHCLKKMREAFWGLGDGKSLDDKSRRHMDHCIDLIRRSLMCTADLSPYPFHWGGDKHKADYDIQRQCRNWDSIYEWSLGRNTTGYVL